SPRQPVSAACFVHQRADRARAVDPVIARDDADLGDFIPAAVAAGVHGVSPIVINFLSIVISMGWTCGTFTVSGWSGRRERIALVAGPVIATTGLAWLTAVALLPGLALMTLSAFVMGIGIGVYNVHLVARAVDSAASDEHRSTATALASVRSIGTAFGA